MNPAVPEALAHCLATEAKTRPLDVDGLGLFHVRLYGEGARHKAGVLFLADRELRAALAGPPGENPPGEDEEVEGDDPQALLLGESAKTPLSFGEWLARTSQKGPDWAAKELRELAATIRRELLAGREVEYPALGRFATKRMAEMTVRNTETGATRTSRERLAPCFTPSDALRRRLER